MTRSPRAATLADMSGHVGTRRRRPRVLIAGGGVAALEAALALRDLASENVEVELLAPDPLFWYRPLAVAEPFGLGHARHFELGQLAAAAGATFGLGALARVDADRRLVRTAAGAEIAFDALLLATGAVPIASVPGAVTFRGPADAIEIEALLREIEAGQVRRVAFAVPDGPTWTVAAYELAFLTAGWADDRDLAVEVSLVTPEQRPLGVFGDASEAVAARLADAGVCVHVDSLPVEVRPGELAVAGREPVPADRVVALPRLRGRYVPGLLHTADDFVEADRLGHVFGAPDVYAAGDATGFPVKQGGIAAQQAEAASEAIAESFGAAVRPRPFRPVLRGLLVTGREPLYLRHDLDAKAQDVIVGPHPLWWPPAKIVGRRLAPFLAQIVSGTISIAPHGHSAAHRPQPLQKS
jgi:sulfide:quinone oxidoreductase